MAYIYGGTKHDLAEPVAPPVQSGRGRKFTGFDPSACGTYAGYGRHIKWGVPPCQDCRDAMAEYSRNRYRPKKSGPGFRDDACGTWAGWQRHHYYNVPVCAGCHESGREYQAERRRARKAERSRTT